MGQVLLLGVAYMLGVMCSSFGQFSSLSKILLEIPSQTDAAGLTAQQLRSNMTLPELDHSGDYGDDYNFDFVDLSEEEIESSVASMMGNFSSVEVERAVQRHDRYLVDSWSHLDNFGRKQVARYIKHAKQRKMESRERRRLTVVILTINRTLPYIMVLLSVLIRGHTPKDFINELDVHVANIERRKGRESYHWFDILRHKLPFITFHIWTETHGEYDTITDETEWYLAHQRLDYIRALKVCQEKESPWCIVMEDDAVPCVGFVHKFRKFVDREEFRVHGIRPVSPRKMLGGGQVIDFSAASNNQRGGPILVPVLKVSNIKLYEWGGEVIAQPVGGNEVQHEPHFSNQAYGLVAEAFPQHSVDQIIAHLEVNDARGKHPVDLEINGQFKKANGLDRIVMVPSLVDHIGFISEHKKEQHINEKRIHVTSSANFRLTG